MHQAELGEAARRARSVHSSTPLRAASNPKPQRPATPRDTVPDFEDEDDAEWEDDLASIGDGDDELESAHAN